MRASVSVADVGNAGRCNRCRLTVKNGMIDPMHPAQPLASQYAQHQNGSQRRTPQLQAAARYANDVGCAVHERAKRCRMFSAATHGRVWFSKSTLSIRSPRSGPRLPRMATGTPPHDSVSSEPIKPVMPRQRAMQGFHVPCLPCIAQMKASYGRGGYCQLGKRPEQRICGLAWAISVMATSRPGEIRRKLTEE